MSIGAGSRSHCSARRLPAALRRALAVLTAVVIAALLMAVPASADPSGPAPDPVGAPVKPVPSRPLPKVSPPQLPPETRLPTASWPAPGAAEVDLPAGLRVAGERAGDEAALGSEPPSRVAGRVRA